MSKDVLSRAQHLSDQELLAQVQLLVHRERETTAVLIAHLAVLEERSLYLAEGCASLFTYCTQVLHLSEHAAYNRIEAARAIRLFPVILERLADGSVNLTTVRMLAPHLTPENHSALLEAAKHKSKRQVEELVAQLRPQPPVPSTIRRLPIARHDLPSAAMAEATMPDAAAGFPWDVAPGPDSISRVPAEDTAPHLESQDRKCCTLFTQASAQPPPRPAVVEPLGSQRYRVQFTATAEMHEKLRLAQDLLRHQIPNGDLGQVIDRALTVLIEALSRRKFAATDRPGESRSPGAASRYISAEVRRTVWRRDGGQCAFVAHNGRRCRERTLLEFHHVVPYSTGGEATADNIQLRCRAHNGYEADLYFGPRIAGCATRMSSLVKEPGTIYQAAERRRMRQGMTPSIRAAPA